jgi:hypothetical protein
MPKTTANFKCNKCGDVFTATSENCTSCKCGLCEVQPSMCMTSYSSRDGKGAFFERLSDGHDNTYYSQDEFYIMKENILDLFEEVVSLSKEVGFYQYYNHEIDEEGNELLKSIHFSKSDFVDKHYTEQNEINFSIHFDKENFKRDDHEIKLISRLTNFKTFLISLRNEEIKLSDRKFLKDYENLDWERTQVDAYDYNFYF